MVQVRQSPSTVRPRRKEVDRRSASPWLAPRRTHGEEISRRTHSLHPHPRIVIFSIHVTLSSVCEDRNLRRFEGVPVGTSGDTVTSSYRLVRSAPMANANPVAKTSMWPDPGHHCSRVSGYLIQYRVVAIAATRSRERWGRIHAPASRLRDGRRTTSGPEDET